MADVPSQRFVLLLRVSTRSQGADGHGVSAQRRDIQLFLNSLQETPEVVAEFVEVESGAKEARPVLEEALRVCREQKASLLVQKVDSITRDLEVLARIVKDPLVTVKVASLPNADNFQIHLFGCLAAQEKEFISTRTKAALAAAKEAVLSTRQSLLGVEQRVLFSAVEAYMNLRRAGKTVTLRENNLRVIQEELRAAKDRFDVGEVTKTDVALAEARLAASISALAAAKGSRVQQKEVFKRDVGKPAGTITMPRSLPKLPKSAKAVKAVAVRNHPEIIALQHDIKQAEYNVERASGALKPTVGLSSSVGYTEMAGEDYRQSGSISLSASSTVYSGGRIPALIRKAMAQRDAQRAGLHLTRLRIEQQAGSAFALLQIARAGRKASEEQIRASKVAFEGIREEAAVGSRTTLDVLNAEQELLDAQAGLISSETDEYIATYRVLSQMGKLTVDALNLPVQKYDPLEYYNLVKKAPSNLSRRGAKLDRILESLSK